MSIYVSDVVNDYGRKLQDWFGEELSAKTVVIHFWDSGDGEAYFVVRFKEEIQCFRIFYIGDKLFLSRDAEYKL